ncbi:hypothetical protein [Rhodopila globiformis]|uniref:Uncharacterized protein n=1 Tax=Rhodopila globiformis TaxID=1071 RepID=A0A2S6NGH2_RHOGL|nr:hypothetical protein [Rhodopila globiformis]PPQ33742.1 hypothetical protein CCS01_13815 [Rhodopila globiformis]
MPMIETLIEPRRVTRVFFDCRNADPGPDDQRRIAAAVAEALALGDDEDDEPDAGYALMPPAESLAA